jgi:hypothetical protein
MRARHGDTETGGQGRRSIPSVLVSVVMLGWATAAGSGAVSSAAALPAASGAEAPAIEDRRLDQDPCWPLDVEGNELVRVLEELRTRDARQLVWVMQNAVAPGGRLTLHLAIAHAETRGRILAVSPAGAAGLAQATPIAVLAEKVEGPLFITADYVRGAEAYYLKKPLGDADTIASFLLAGGRRERARELLEAAWRLRREGFEELALLEPVADAGFTDRVARYDDENAATLERLGALIESNASVNRVRGFRDATRARYRALRDVQRRAWRSYHDELAARRDAILRDTWGTSEKRVLEVAAYEAGEMLALQLDVRFSPTRMAEFLSRHFESKVAEAAAMGVDEEKVEELAVGLYNGGAHNIKRMMSGLIVSLPETDAYMKKVPDLRSTLEATLADAAR